MTERRYSEDEVAEIFERASQAQQEVRRQVTPAAGLSLAQLQEIGGEVGIPAELVASAARSLDHEGRPTIRRFLGLPVGVGRTIQLERELTEQEWEHLVVDLRRTFDARGKVRMDGPFRQWTNGNLQALLEPTPSGPQLRLRTLKGNVLPMLGAAGIMGAFSVLVAIAAVLQGKPASAFVGVAALALMSLGFLGSVLLPLPGWARTRRQQMEAVASRLLDRMADGSAALPPADEA